MRKIGATTTQHCLATRLSLSVSAAASLVLWPIRGGLKSENMPRDRVIEVDVASAAPTIDTIDVTYLLDLTENLGDKDADEDYANKLRELLDEAINWFDSVESDIDSVKDGGGPQYALKIDKIKKECNKGRASVRFLKSKVEPNAVKTGLLVDYRQELRNILKRHTTTIAALSRSIEESLRADVGRVAMAWARSKMASDATMSTAPSGEHITEMMRGAPRGGVQGYSAIEFEIALGGATEAARADAVGTRDGQDQGSQIDECTSQ